ncbi:MAG: S-layer homology domain-containing protein [Oscillospiraceae bacterium]|nr:S-layer homology domain-containing protein [Oscillospiraceae bacterium]
MNSKRIFSQNALRIISAILLLVMILPLFSSAQAQNNWNMEYFYKNYSDPHFNLNNEPNRAMSIEEFIALMHAYSYYGKGADSVTVVDKNGKLPSAWCGKYVQAEANKKVFDPERISWSDPVTVAFAAQFMARAKGKYSYDANNLYSFSGTQNLNADDILYLCTAIDYGLIPYKAGMDVSAKILRRDARKYEIPTTLSPAKPTMSANATTMRELNAYFIDCYWDLAKAREQLNRLKQNSDHVTMVTFYCGYINGDKVSPGNHFLGCEIEHPGATAPGTDPQLEAIQYCKDTGKLALLGITNAYGRGFAIPATLQMLINGGTMQIAIDEIMTAVRQYDLDGVNLGIEITDPAYASLRDEFSTFVKLLSSALHSENKVLLVSVGAYFTEAQEHASIYDYTQIGNVADYVHIILYDDFNDTGFPYRRTHGPMSNLVRTGRCLRYAAVKMDRSKILLGLGSFAIDFNLTANTAQDTNYGDALVLLRAANAQIGFSNDSALGAYFEYTDSSANKHRVYLETDGTVIPRANLVKNYNLGGFSIFNINDNNIPVYNATRTISSFKQEVTSAITAGLVPVSLRNKYDKPILRHEFCSVIVKFIESKSNMSATTFLASKGKTINYTFTDTYDRNVLIANALGIVNGYGNGIFGPNRTITRQEAAAMLKRLAGVFGVYTPNSTPVTFRESATLPAWAKEGIDFVSACVDLKHNKRVMGGTGNNMFSPQGSYTREQTFMSIFRLYHAF